MTIEELLKKYNYSFVNYNDKWLSWHQYTNEWKVVKVLNVYSKIVYSGNDIQKALEELIKSE